MECTVVGGGVQALSTGVLLESLGHSTTMISDEFAYIDGSDDPPVATDYAAASVYPVQVESEYSEDELIRRAESTFEPFWESDGVPVRKHTHYYLYENAGDRHLPDRMGAQPVSQYDGEVPTRAGETVEGGYVCEEYFVEMPEYVPQLYHTYRELGGDIERRTVTATEVDNLAGIVFNCTGYGSRELFDDDSLRAMKGHILQVPYEDGPLPFSYTYTPSGYDDEYAYMYPRRETVLFGGSYLPGDIVDGQWVGESPDDPMTVDGVTIPRRLYDVTADIMSEYTDITPERIDAKYGYRPYRADGMRIERTGDIVHNYGHGGAGVSMSWWSALRAVSYIETVSEDVLPDVAAAVAV
ncbi:FAD-dependent oxidoreductase [Halorientalis litorea]|jgi:D-amino-acid oxidase|uniref:FAD-dependent oxidoreductase n=1 Tax=Halorientalis litorea TaxID=2931977 RepID=UPI001FF282EB|nr:FAD-dependent oxidoreductase [Halorientalis litorea]